MTFAITFKQGDRVRLSSDPSVQGHFRRYCPNGQHAIVDFDIDGQQSVEHARLRHAPVLVIGARPAIPTTCPDGHPVGPQDCERYDPATRKWTNVRVVACGFCDFVQVLNK